MHLQTLLPLLFTLLTLLPLSHSHSHNTTHPQANHPNFTTFNHYPSDVTEVPTSGPSHMNLTSIMSARGCKIFAHMLLACPEAFNAYQDNIEGGLTVFCPMDDPFKAFLPIYNNLTSPSQVSFLEYFGIPIYQSISSLRSNNGLMNTLATDRVNNFDFTVQNDGEVVTLKTTNVTAKITRTLIDKQPLAIYTIDKVLLPKELFKDTTPPTPAPAPAPTPTPFLAPAPAPQKAGDVAPKLHNQTVLESGSPADSPNGIVVDQIVDKNVAVKCDGGIRVNVILLSLFLGLLMVL